MGNDPHIQDLLSRCVALGRRPTPQDVEQICGGNPELIPHMRRALGMADEGSDFVDYADHPTRVNSGDDGPVKPGWPAERPLGPTLPAERAYKIIRMLGQGGMGMVYLAHDQKLDRQVALKRLRSPEQTVQRGIERFLREAKAIAALNHPNIVTIYELAHDDHGPFIVMEYVGGGDLLRHIGAKGKLAVPEALAMVRGIGQGLSYAHRRSIFHRDIKPSNVLLAQDGTPKLVDFGLAQMGRESNLSATGYAMGTLAYMAPEQRQDAKHVDQRSDIYALAKTLYEMLTGQLPEPVDLEAVPASLRMAMAKALKPRPEDRHFSVEEFLAELNQPIDAGAPGSGTTAAGTCPQCGVRNPENVRFCRSCGSSLFEDCPKCGAPDRIGVEHCGSCGVHRGKYKIAAESLASARYHLAKFDYALALKEAAAGLESNYLVAELRQVHGQADAKRQKLDRLRVQITLTVAQEQYEQAEDLVKSALAHAPGAKDLKGLLADLPVRKNRRDARRIVSEARTALREKNLALAEELAGAACGLDQDNHKAARLRDVLIARKARHERAIAEARDLLKAKEYEKVIASLRDVLTEWRHEQARQLREEAKQALAILNGILEQARAAMSRGDYEEALRRFEAANALRKSSQLLREIARIQRLLTRRRLVRVAAVCAAAAVVALAGVVGIHMSNRLRLSEAVKAFDENRVEEAPLDKVWAFPLRQPKAGQLLKLKEAYTSARFLDEKEQWSQAAGQWAAVQTELNGIAKEELGGFRALVEAQKAAHESGVSRSEAQRLGAAEKAPGEWAAAQEAQTAAAARFKAGQVHEARTRWAQARDLYRIAGSAAEAAAIRQVAAQSEQEKAAAAARAAAVQDAEKSNDARTRASNNRIAAESAGILNSGAKPDATALWALGDQEMAEAAQAFVEEKFDAASETWQKAAMAYDNATAYAAAVRALRQEWADALTRHDELWWRRHGGDAWAKAQAARAAAEVDGVDLVALKAACDNARALMKEAATVADPHSAAEQAGAQVRAATELARERMSRGDYAAAERALQTLNHPAIAALRNEIALKWKRLDLAPGVKLELVLIPPSRDAQVRAGAPRPFYMGVTEVTQAQWKALMGVNPSFFPNPDSLPVEQVSWREARDFCDKAWKHGLSLRLPTEVEWEYACRAGTVTPYNTGNVLGPQAANFRGAIDNPKTMVAGGFACNSWGLFDMHGNVWEWCSDTCDPFPRTWVGVTPEAARTQLAECRALRGGSWMDGPQDCASGSRGGALLSAKLKNVGFRVCMDAQ